MNGWEKRKRNRAEPSAAIGLVGGNLKKIVRGHFETPRSAGDAPTQTSVFACLNFVPGRRCFQKRRIGAGCKPSSVPPSFPGGWPFIWGAACTASPATLPEDSGEQPSNALLFGLAPGGVYLAGPVTRTAGELLPHRFTLTCPLRGRRSVLCGTIPGVAPAGRYPAPCSAELGLSSGHPYWVPAAIKPTPTPCLWPCWPACRQYCSPFGECE